MNRKTGLIVLIVSLSMACNQIDKGVNSPIEGNQKIDAKSLSEGFSLLESSCFSCHSPNASINKSIAPPMASIKQYYIDDETTQQDFTKALIAFLGMPTEENAKIPDAIKRYGVMPKMNFSESEITQIAQYIYNTELEKPDWYKKQYTEEKEKHALNSNLSTSPLALGKKIAMHTKSTLGSQLKQALNTKGTEHALSFCSTRAIPLTDSMALLLNAKIKRVSDKNRNPNNIANSMELKYIEHSKSALANGLVIKPKLITTDSGYIGYYPIMTNSMCLQCHGKPEKDISQTTFTIIKQRYPNDNAIDYQEDELRGIWVIEMEIK